MGGKQYRCGERRDRTRRRRACVAVVAVPPKVRVIACPTCGVPMLEGEKCLWAQEADYQERAMAEAEARLTILRQSRFRTR